MSQMPNSSNSNQPKSKLRDGNRSVEIAELGVLKEKISELVSKSPEKAAMILTLWIHGTTKSAAIPTTRRKAG